jgi:phage protein D
MALPRKLKHLNLFNDGNNWQGIVESLKVTGFKQPIDDAEWTITTLTHSVSPDNGFTTSMELEVKIDEFDIE